jgi:perosamine synthetase
VVVNPFRRQLPVYSPVSAASVASGLVDALRPGADPQQRLARLLAERYRVDRVVLFRSGTHALTAALQAALARVESEGAAPAVALPGYGCYDLATAAVAADARITLYDLDPDTLAPDWRSVEAALEEGARVLVLAPLYGYPIDWDTAEELASAHGAVLVEDAAQGAGGTWRGQLLGALGPLSVLSFGRGKGWTGGHGGVLLARGDALPGLPAEPHAGGGARAVATALALLVLGRPALFGLPRALPWLRLGETVYRAPTPAAGISPFAAALAFRSHPIVIAEVEERRSAARELTRALQGVQGIRAVESHPAGTPGYLRLPCRMDPDAFSTSELALLARLGLERGYPATLAGLDAVAERLVAGHRPRLPGAEALARDLVTLPTHSRTTRGARSELVRVLAKADHPAPTPPNK